MSVASSTSTYYPGGFLCRPRPRSPANPSRGYFPAGARHEVLRELAVLPAFGYLVRYGPNYPYFRLQHEQRPSRLPGTAVLRQRRHHGPTHTRGEVAQTSRKRRGSPDHELVWNMDPSRPKVARGLRFSPFNISTPRKGKHDGTRPRPRWCHSQEVQTSAEGGFHIPRMKGLGRIKPS